MFPKQTVMEPMIAVQDATANRIDVGDNPQGPDLWMRRDYEDNSAPTGTLDAFRGAKGTFKVACGRTKTFSLVPAVQQAAYEGVIGTAYMPAWRKWISTDDAATPHYGLKWYITQTNAYFEKVFDKNGGWQIDFWIKVQYKDWRRGTT